MILSYMLRRQPGVRKLQHVVQHLPFVRYHHVGHLALTFDAHFCLDLFLEQTREGVENQVPFTFEGLSIKTAQKVVEKDLITRALQETGGNRTRAARLLEISHPSLLSKMKAYAIDM